MSGIQNYGAFIMAIFIFQLLPGAGTITILNATARHGIRAGLKAVVGTLTGDFIYMSAAVLGLAAILSAYPRILATAQWIGVFYLGWIGLKLLWETFHKQADDENLEQNGWAYFQQALLVSLTNPKVIMFFMAFFPLFLGPQSKPTTLFVLMVHVTAISLIYQTCLVLVGNTLATRLSRWQYARQIATRLAGIALIGFAIKLALNKQ